MIPLGSSMGTLNKGHPTGATIMKTKSQQKVARLLKRNADWIQSHGLEVFNRAGSKISELLMTGGIGVVRELKTPVGLVATYHGHCGIACLQEGDYETGWMLIERACLYRQRALWCAENAVAPLGPLQRRWPVWTLNIQDSACLLCKGLADDNQQLIESEVRRFERVASGKLHIEAKFWKKRWFEPATLKLSRLFGWQVNWPGLDNHGCGTFDRAIEIATDAALFSQSLEEICDFHLANIDETSKTWFVPFGNSPFDLVPFEILAFQRLNPQAEISHPLATWCGKPTAFALEAAYDDMLIQIETEYC